MAINTNILKTYAPEARRAFIAAVKARAARFGITEQGSSAIREEGNVAIINEQPYPRSFAQQRRDLDQKIAVRGYASVMEEVAYTWFNRFAAIRYMELHDYLEHGVRVLSHPNGGSTPEIIEKAAQVDMPGLKRDQVIALKLDGTKDDDLYRMLVVAQCNALHAAMPFLFEKIDDETELLLPDNLLHSESLIRQLVERIPEADWKHIEIIGWLYQFYISEKKDQVIGKVVKSEDIPAATQLFTPNWIVKYMVQNSLGAMWLATYPNSPLREKMEYYVGPGEQPSEVQAQIDAETPKALNPEQISFLDPASGSGHILVEAYALFKEIYLERGYRLRDIPRLVIEKNLYGIDVDDRAAQLSGFSLLMRAREDDRHVLSGEVALNVLAIQESRGLDPETVASSLQQPVHVFDLVPSGDLLPQTIPQPTLSVRENSTAEQAAIAGLVRTFEAGKTIGSLISVPQWLTDALPLLEKFLDTDRRHDLFTQKDHHYAVSQLAPLVRQAKVLSRRFDIVVANPPYMGGKGMMPELRAYLDMHFPDARADLYAAFIDHFRLKATSHVALVTMQGWMFLPSFENLRKEFLKENSLLSLVQLGPRAFEGIGGEVVQSVAFSFRAQPAPGYISTFFDATKHALYDKSSTVNRSTRSGGFLRDQSIFLRAPGAPLAYWLSEGHLSAFAGPSLSTAGAIKSGIGTSDNARFLRLWHEVSSASRCSPMESKKDAKWYPYEKGGGYRRWYGNKEYVVNWGNDGADIKLAVVSNPRDPGTTHWSRRIFNTEYFFLPSLTWSDIGGGLLSVRKNEAGFIHDAVGVGFYKTNESCSELTVLGFLNSSVAEEYAKFLCPTLHFKPGQMGRIPLLLSNDEQVDRNVSWAVDAARDDWNSTETSWDFAALPLIEASQSTGSIKEAYLGLRATWLGTTERMKAIQEDNNDLFIAAYGLQAEVRSEVPIEQVSLRCNPAYRYGGNKSEAEIEALLLADTIREYISYAVGCMFGRYSPDVPGLILANQAETLQDYLKRVPQTTFLPDADNVIPVMEEPLSGNDVTERFLEFLRITFGEESFGENLAYIEGAIGKDMPTFFKRDFYADHLRRYKKRPIYWLFSSGKEKAFEALVYLHRYNEGTLARMRLEYVVPLQTQMATRIERLINELKTGSLSSAETKRRNLQIEKLQKQQVELRRFEEELHHFADQRIKLDLDDGVKVNYSKFGNLLADVKAITGGKDDE
jgi:hypothetical protein